MTNPFNQRVYFAYGANTNFESMACRCPDAEFIAAATLDDHQLTFRGVADVAPAPGRQVTGALWMISDTDERSLDRFEGFPHLYIKRTVVVNTVEFGDVEAMIYVMRDRHEQWPPNMTYYNILMQGYIDSGIALGQLDDAVTNAEVDYKVNQYNDEPL